NTGSIELTSSGNETDLQILPSGLTLEGGGKLILSGADSVVMGATSDATLTNVDNVISGAGQLGNGQLTLVNETAGIIDGNVAGGVLVLDTGGNIITNYGTIEASNGGTVEIRSGISNAGLLEVGAGSTMQIDSSVANSGTIETNGTLHISDALSGT